MLAAVATLSVNASVSLTKVQLEYQDNPFGEWNPKPHFSWQITTTARDVKQSAYQIVVAHSEKDLKDGANLVWDSGKIHSDVSTSVEFDGQPLESAQTYYWKVNVWTNKGNSSSKVQHWTTTLLKQSDWKAQWIGCADSSDFKIVDGRTVLPARYLRKEFKADAKVQRATLYICGLGLSVCYINGQRVGKDVLAPLPSYYSVASNFLTYDVTKLIQAGNNAIGVILGGGHFTGTRYKMPNLPEQSLFGTPRLIAQLVIEDANGTKTIISDESWKATNKGPIREQNEYDGEKYDARMELGNWTQTGYNESAWQNVALMKCPTNLLRGQMSPCMQIMDEIHAKSVRKVGDNRYIVDMGQNFVGWARVTLSGDKGKPVAMRFAETLQKDSNQLYTANLRTALAEDIYTPANDGKFTWEPQFTFHGGRYIEVTGTNVAPTVADFTGCVIYDKMDVSGSFKTSNDMLNKIYNAAYWGIRSNYHGMATDCPQRDERFGWLGDRATGCYGESYVFNNNQFYNKWMLDIEESMTPEGDICDVSPHYWSFWSKNVTWPAAYIYAINMIYERYGNDYSIKSRYDSMRKWILFVKNNIYSSGIVTHDTYGDWCMPPESPSLIHSQDPARKTDGRILSTTVYYDLLGLMQKFAKISNHPGDIAEYQQLRDEIYTAYNKQFFNADKGCYDNNTVTANILSLECGLVPKGSEQKVIDNIISVTDGPVFNGHISTGVLGVQHLMRGLTRHGDVDLAYKIATNETYPSWGYMINNNATTIWELWNGNTADPAMNSGNHVMLLGDLIVWMYEDLGGIRSDASAPGFRKIVMQPYFPKGLDHVAASYDSPYGQIKSYWTLNGDKLTWIIAVPANSTATVIVPTKYNINPQPMKKGVHTVTKKGDNTVIELGSGMYELASGK
jgi:alpha-L-rhamnosidase